jgi:hypothetical protein
MRTTTPSSTRLLPDGSRLRNRLLAALPVTDYRRILKHLHMHTGVVGHPLQEHGAPITDVYFPNGGVFSVTNEMYDGQLVEVATVGREGMLGIGVSLGDRSLSRNQSSGRCGLARPGGAIRRSLSVGDARSHRRLSRRERRHPGRLRDEQLLSLSRRRLDAASVLPLGQGQRLCRSAV